MRRSIRKRAEQHDLDLLRDFCVKVDAFQRLNLKMFDLVRFLDESEEAERFYQDISVAENELLPIQDILRRPNGMRERGVRTRVEKALKYLRGERE